MRSTLLGLALALLGCGETMDPGADAGVRADDAGSPPPPNDGGRGADAFVPMLDAGPPRPSLPCFADPGTPAGAELQLALTPSRASGVAPLAVFFDTVGTTATNTTRPFHDLGYCWDFGDELAGTFATTGASKNQARGPVAGHVFERPGSYTVSVTARDRTGRFATQSVTITVDDPDVVFAGTSTVCLSAAGDFAGCPAGATQITGATLATLQPHVASGRRLLLHRGETFTAGSRLQLNVPGPGIIGAYGNASDPRPRIDTTDYTIRVSDQDPAFSDWRVMDLDVDGQSDGDSRVLTVEGGAMDLLVLRVRATRVGNPITAGDSIIDYWNNNGSPGHDIIDGLAIADCELRDLVGGAGHNFAYIASHRFVFLGNVFRNSIGGEHVFRAPWIDRGVMSHNDMGVAPEPRHVIKIHGPRFNDPNSVGYGRYTERLVFSDNTLRCMGGTQWCAAFGPQNESSDERLRDILVERNFFEPGEATQVAVMIWAQDTAVRDNILSRGDFRDCVVVEQRGIEPPPARVTLTHNTCFGTGARISLASVSSIATEVLAFNNLIAGAMAGLPSNLSMQAGNVTTDLPGFVVASPMGWPDFALTAGSPAADTAIADHASFWDFSGAPRSLDPATAGAARPDVGALELAR